jgi:CHAT domain-containing protein
VHGFPYNKDEIAQAARQALEYLDRQEDPAVYLETLHYLKFASGDEEISQDGFPEELLYGSIDRFVQKLGIEKTQQMVEQAYRHATDQQLTLRILLDAAPLFKNHLNEVVYHLRVIRTFARSQGAETYDLEHPPLESLQALYAQAGELARQEDWDPAYFAATLLTLADVSVALDAEAFGLQLLDEAIHVAPYATARIRDSMTHFRALLLLNDGVNAVNREDWNTSTTRYSEALATLLDLNAGQRMHDLLKRLVDVVKRADEQATDTVCALLEARIDSIEVVAGEQVTQQVQSVIDCAVRNQLEHGAGSGVLWRLLQLASARRFAAMLAAGSAYQVTSEQVAPQLLQRIRELRMQLRKQGYIETASDRMVDSILLSPYTVAGVSMSGKTVAERLANLEHQYDSLLYAALMHSAQGNAGLLASETSLRATLGPIDVIIQYFVLDATDDAQTHALLVSAITTREETTWLAVRFGNRQPRINMEIDGVAVELTEISAMIQALREHIQEDPEGEPLSENAAASIESVNGLLIEPIQERLEQLYQSGKRHLCIVPPGPLAYAPLHILGDVPGALAEAWSITYLPTLQLLVRNYGGPTLLRRRETTLSACGISFTGNQAGYVELPEAVSEATAVAHTMGNEPLLEQDATEHNLLEALLKSQYIHIATHGYQNAIAPCFHKLVLSPDGVDDGDLHAHELLGRDLRGLKLVTLSACETALGRYDRGMNPHGLPATLLLAGAETVIGTLWEIESSCSERFFTTLYKFLSMGQGKLAAYSGALQVTREQHPEFRDWGAFYFLGDWN